MKSFVPYRQARLQCCGINEAADWTRYLGLPDPPSSCYSTRFVQYAYPYSAPWKHPRAFGMANSNTSVRFSLPRTRDDSTRPLNAPPWFPFKPRPPRRFDRFLRPLSSLALAAFGARELSSVADHRVRDAIHPVVRASFFAAS